LKSSVLKLGLDGRQILLFDTSIEFEKISPSKKLFIFTDILGYALFKLLEFKDS